MLRLVSLMVGMLLVTISSAYAVSNPLSTGLDIIGAKSDIISVISPDAELDGIDIVGGTVDQMQIVSPNVGENGIEIVGTTANNITITSPKALKKQPKVIENNFINIYDDYRSNGTHSHLGVDAWYGEYWFESQRNTPKWPQLSI